MSTPQEPKPHPSEPTKEDTVHPEHQPHGVPDGAKDADATGLPNSDRQDSETAGSR